MWCGGTHFSEITSVNSDLIDGPADQNVVAVFLKIEKKLKIQVRKNR